MTKGRGVLLHECGWCLLQVPKEVVVARGLRAGRPEALQDDGRAPWRQHTAGRATHTCVGKCAWYPWYPSPVLPSPQQLLYPDAHVLPPVLVGPCLPQAPQWAHPGLQEGRLSRNHLRLEVAQGPPSQRQVCHTCTQLDTHPTHCGPFSPTVRVWVDLPVPSGRLLLSASARE